MALGTDSRKFENREPRLAWLGKLPLSDLFEILSRVPDRQARPQQEVDWTNTRHSTRVALRSPSYISNTLQHFSMRETSNPSRTCASDLSDLPVRQHLNRDLSPEIHSQSVRSSCLASRGGWEAIRAIVLTLLDLTCVLRNHLRNLKAGLELAKVGALCR